MQCCVYLPQHWHVLSHCQGPPVAAPDASASVAGDGAAAAADGKKAKKDKKGGGGASGPGMVLGKGSVVFRAAVEAAFAADMGLVVVHVVIYLLRRPGQPH